jgi:hypothetical protein
MLSHLVLLNHMLGVQSFNNFHLLANTTASRRFLAGALWLEQTGAWLWTLSVSSPMTIFTTVPTLRLSLFLLNLVAIQLQFGVGRVSMVAPIFLDLIDFGTSLSHSHQ